MIDRSLRTEGMVFLYNLGVILSGIYVASQINVENRPLLFGVGIALALGWTIYFRYAMYSRIAEMATEEENGSSSE